jgi:dienelactone hydrolase
VLALHIVDDSFLQPQRGTSAGDHLISGLVPTVLVLLLAWAYPRLRAGVRASLALAAGLFAVAVGGGEAGYYTLEVGPSGDDYTGLLTIGAGLVLLSLGALTLWRSRRLDDRLLRRYARRTLIGTAGLLVFFFVVLPVQLGYAFTHAAGDTALPRAELGRAHEDVTFRTSDGLGLSGWYVPSRNGAAVIAFPGRGQPQKHTRMLVGHGYGVLLFDPRGEGESEGTPNPFGWHGTRDLKAALAYLRDRPDVDDGRIGGLGLSVGGELLIQTAAETSALKAVVSEGAGFRSVREHVDSPGVANALLLPHLAVLTGAVAVFTDQAPPAHLKSYVGRIAPRPVFLIHATHGQGGEGLNADYYRAAGEPKTRWEIADAKHTGGIDAHPEEYERRVIGFFDKALLKATR